MSRAMIQAAVTMNQLQSKLDVIGSNMANSQTTGYKSRQADFSSLLFQEIENMTRDDGTQQRLTPEGIRVGSGAKLGSINLDLGIGSIQDTGRELDMALLEKSHFFQMQVTHNGVVETQYTRDGAFYLNPVNNNQSLMLTTKDGHPVLGENGPILMNKGFDSIQIQSNGQVVVERNNQTEVVGQIAVVETDRPRLLEAAGQNGFRLPDLADLGLNLGEIMQNTDANADVLKSQALENSNVDTGKQMTELVMAQRSYQFNAKTISMGDQMMGLINQIR